MKRLLYLYLAFFLCATNLCAQDEITEEIEQAYVLEKFDEIISNYSQNTDEYSSKALYFVGKAYFMKEDDANCIKFMDLAIQKDENNADAYFVKGQSQTYSGKFGQAIESIEKAIQINPANSDFHSGLGDVYLNKGDHEKALNSYQAAIKLENPSDRAFAMIPQVYAKENKTEEALEAFYQSKNNISKNSQSYITALYNIGLYEFLKQEYGKAEEAYVELLQLIPDDFPSISKLIQVYYGKKEYDKAIPLKQKMYEGQKAGLMEGYLKDMFCFDQFRWNGQLVQVFERYEEGDGKLYYKHLFYLLDENNDIVYKIQTENSPISIELGGPKYVLGTDHNGTHYNWGIGIEKDFDYENLKKAVIAILDKKIKPAASTSKKY